MKQSEDVCTCRHCGEEIEFLDTGRDMLTWCDNCQLLEGDTEYIPLEEYEESQS